MVFTGLGLGASVVLIGFGETVRVEGDGDVSTVEEALGEVAGAVAVGVDTRGRGGCVVLETTGAGFSLSLELDPSDPHAPRPTTTPTPMATFLEVGMGFFSLGALLLLFFCASVIPVCIARMRSDRTKEFICLPFYLWA